MAGGRPTKLDDKLLRQLVELVAAGVYLDAAAESVGVHRSTIHRWIESGRRARSGLRRRLFIEIEKATGKAETVATLEIRKAGAKGDWRASLAWLARRVPERWAPPRPTDPQIGSAEATAGRIQAFLRMARASVPASPEEAAVPGTTPLSSKFDSGSAEDQDADRD